MNNTAFGKQCESKRKRKNVSLVGTRPEAGQRISATTSFSLCSMKTSLPFYFQNKSYTKIDRQSSLFLFRIFQKCTFRFHYTIMKKEFQATLLYSYTENLVHRIKLQDVYSDMGKKPFKDHFDFSNYEAAHKLYDSPHKMETLHFKDEMGGEVMNP